MTNSIETYEHRKVKNVKVHQMCTIKQLNFSSTNSQLNWDYYYIYISAIKT
jgi:hypothetical protein